jgi:hypothetical protein
VSCISATAYLRARSTPTKVASGACFLGYPVRARHASSSRSIAPLQPEQLSELHGLRLQHSTPLWYYILKEAELLTGGQRLAGVGARIVAEVFIGLLEGDRHSFLRQDPHWTPTLAVNGVFGMTELLRFAGLTPPNMPSRPATTREQVPLVDLTPCPEDSAAGRRGPRKK